MDTSDSEYFESADEDIEQDSTTLKKGQKTVSGKPPTLDVVETTSTLEKLADITITTKEEEESIKRQLLEKEALPSNLEKAKEDEEGTKTQVVGKEDNFSSIGKTKSIKEEKVNIRREVVATSTAENAKPSHVENRENLWDDSELDWGKEAEWENVEHVEENAAPERPEPTEAATSSWGSWGSWNVSSIISTATSSVSTLTQNISTALETGIGVPDPEELAKIDSEVAKEISDETNHGGFAFGNLVMGVSHLTKLVESTGTKVISGGLDTLESIGKKTMQVLQDGDPGLKKKRAFLTIEQDKPVLSQLLREAKEKAEEENRELQEKYSTKRRTKNYETLFDDHQGLVHLEALEMLSKQCDIKLQSLLESHSDESLVEIQETMDQIKELCELPDEDDEEHGSISELCDKLETAVVEINIPISYKKLTETWDETEEWLRNVKLELVEAWELHEQAIETLAQLTALAVEQFHKSAELLLIKEHRSTADEADSLVQLTTSLTAIIGLVAAKFSEKLNAKASDSKMKDQTNSLITNVFLEAANSSSYIQDAFQLLIPILQVGAI